ncbi:unnamed protein product [Gongylonema pulchrum]|uniref:GPAT/DHAPAT C-terminal domain-containing protein n=1 Tax=Gongylonema pulchrum TaxID=637853 RepID=A0A3P7MRF7_9BILA|nr:unnamed protein product [Gongylonema pulchrum]
MFTSYVQALIREAEHPVEFFVEGTRSRSGKSLYPKCGLLQMCLEPFLRCQIYDLIKIHLCIFDLNFRAILPHNKPLGTVILELSTSLNRMLGVVCIMNRKRFGNIYVNFGHPISIRKYFEGRIERLRTPWQVPNHRLSEGEKQAVREFAFHVIRVHNANSTITVWPYACLVLLQVPNHRLSEGEKQAVREFAFHVIRVHNANSTITVWPYACLVLLQMTSAEDGRRTMKFEELQTKLEDFIHLALKLGCKIMIKKSVAGDLRNNICRQHLQLHSELFVGLSGHLANDSVVELRRFSCLSSVGAIKYYMEESLCLVVLSQYANQVGCLFKRFNPMTHLKVSRKLSSSTAEESEMFHANSMGKLLVLFNHEFVIFSTEEEISELASQSFNRFFYMGLFVKIFPNRGIPLQLFIIKYQCVMQSLMELKEDQFTEKMLFDHSLQFAVNLHSVHAQQPICITSDLVRNALLALCSLSAVTKHDGKQYMVRNDAFDLRKWIHLLDRVSSCQLPIDSAVFVSKI